MKPPVDGCARENCASVLPSGPMAAAAAVMASGKARPAVAAISPKPDEKLIAGPMVAIAAAGMPVMARARRRCSRPPPAGGLLGSAKGTGSSLLTAGPPDALASARAHFIHQIKPVFGVQPMQVNIG